MVAEVIQTLMCYDELDFAEFERDHAISFRDYFGVELAKLAPLELDGLVATDAQCIRVSPKGRLLMSNFKQSLTSCVCRALRPFEFPAEQHTV